MASNQEIMQRNKANLINLEDMYVNSKIDNLDTLVANRKEELIEQLSTYQKQCTKIERNKDGVEFEKLNVNPFVMQRYFFKSINPMSSREPKYSAEKLSIVWELYQDILCQVNVEIGEFVPTLTSFCSFAGITLATLRNYKNSSDMGLRTIVEKISDLCFDTNVTLAQKGDLKERSTIFRMKSEQEKVEKEQPEIHLHEHNETKIDIEALNSKLASIQNYNQRKAETIEVQKVE